MSAMGAMMATRPRIVARSSFMGARPRMVARPRASVNATRRATVMAGTEYPNNWLNKDPLVFVLGFLGWTVPSTIGVSAFGGDSLFGLFTKSIGENLSHFPIGPPLTDKFWLLFALYHVGLFTTLLLGQIGVNGRRQGYW